MQPENSKYPILDDIDVPDDVTQVWQKTLNILASLVGIPAALIMRVHPREIEVFLSSKSEGNVYSKGEKASLDSGLYCETVMDTRKELLVSNAKKDTAWDHNPDIKLGKYLNKKLETFNEIMVEREMRIIEIKKK